MKYLIFSALLLCAAFVSCKKELVNDAATPGTIHGDWSIASDSTMSQKVDGGSKVGSDYVGLAPDHFKFSDSMLYVHEGSTIDTGVYTLGKDSIMQVIYKYRYQDGLLISGSGEWFKMTRLDAHTAVLTNGGIIPGGYYVSRKLTLKR